MRIKSQLSKKIEEYLLKNPINRSFRKPYTQAAQALNTTDEKVRQVWRDIRKSGKISDIYYIQTGTPVETEGKLTTSSGELVSSISEDKDTINISKVTTEEVSTLEDLTRICEIDTTIWDIQSWSCRVYSSIVKVKGEDKLQNRYSVSAKLSKRKLDKDLGFQKDLLLRELFEASPKVSKKDYGKVKDYTNCLYEICIPDIHFSKLAWAEETDEDFDLKISVDRYKAAVKALLDRVNIEAIGRILLPIGNDMIHVDNENNMTTAGTPQDADGRFAKTIRVVKDVLIDVIKDLSNIAPVDVLVIRGNHDATVSFMIGEILDAYFHNDENIEIYNSPKWRKYYKFGSTSILMTHGDKEKHTDLGLIFATEQPQLWAATKHRFCQLGHLHKSKTTSYISVDTHNGFQVQILPSLTATDEWHNSRGYLAKKQAKAFLFEETEGLIAEFTYSL